MRKLVSVLMIVLTISLFGCSNDYSSGSTADLLHLKFTFEGKNYYFVSSSFTSLQKLIMGMEDVNNVQTRMDLWLPGNLTVGTFPISDATPTDANFATLYGANLSVNDATYRGKSGTLKITIITPHFITGTFNFTGVDESGATFNVTNGSFKAFN